MDKKTGVERAKRICDMERERLRGGLTQTIFELLQFDLISINLWSLTHMNWLRLGFSWCRLNNFACLPQLLKYRLCERLLGSSERRSYVQSVVNSIYEFMNDSKRSQVWNTKKFRKMNCKYLSFFQNITVTKYYIGNNNRTNHIILTAESCCPLFFAIIRN